MKHVHSLSSKDRNAILFIDNCSSAKYRGFVDAYDGQTFWGAPAEIRAATEEFPGSIDLALLPVAALPGVRSNFTRFGNYGIASDGATHSVILFSHYEIAELLRQSMPIYLTSKSVTSRQLLTQLARMTYNLPLNTCQTPDMAQACLLIGDDAISMAARGAFAYSFDLGAWWKNATGCPFVFAHWIANRRMGLDRKDVLLRLMSETLSRAKVSSLYNRLSEASEGACGVEFWRKYHNAIREKIDENGYRGMRKFLDQLMVQSLELDGVTQ